MGQPPNPKSFSFCSGPKSQHLTSSPFLLTFSNLLFFLPLTLKTKFVVSRSDVWQIPTRPLQDLSRNWAKLLILTGKFFARRTFHPFWDLIKSKRCARSAPFTKCFPFLIWREYSTYFHCTAVSSRLPLLATYIRVVTTSTWSSASFNTPNEGHKEILVRNFPERCVRFT